MRCLVCDCEGTMPLDAKRLAKAGVEVERVHRQLCRAELASFEAALGDDLLVACTQEAPLFSEVAEEHGAAPRFVNIRETAGWSAEAPSALPKIAALIAAATHDDTPARLRAIESDGTCLVVGSGQAALEAARLLAPRLSVSLLLSDEKDVLLPPVLDLTVHRGRVRSINGALGGYEAVIDGYAPMLPSSRVEPAFAMERDGARTTCALILDMGETALLPHPRDGYHRADPGDPAAILRAAFALADMAGTFDKPLYVVNETAICAHSRSHKPGCSKCLDVCPAGAIAPAGDHVAVDPTICAGCGQCHAVCPTGAIEYAYPTRADIMARLQIMLAAHHGAGGRDGVILFHDELGRETISAMARRGRGLPAHVLPFALHSSTLPGHVEMLAAVASGAAGIAVLVPPHRADETAGLERETALANTILKALWIGESSHILLDPDPDVIEETLYAWRPKAPRAPQTFAAAGRKRDVARTVLNALAPDSAIVIPLGSDAPYGRVAIDRDACTLCMACTSACPTGALLDTPDEPRLRFTESACVQCGICVATCPENALALDPRLNTGSEARAPMTLHEEEPFHCTSCGKPFATRSTIERIGERLAGHTMFAGERARLMTMCETCRVETMANGPDDPFSAAPRPRVRTTMDYEAGTLSADDFLIED